ncbi:hypothetical protein VKS41_000439 [Umbelopsis sp. WA50703]
MIRASLGAILQPKVHSVSTISRAWHARPTGALGAVRWYSDKPVDPTITFEELRERIKAEKPDNYTLIDVREPDELAAGSIPTASNVPLSQFADAFAFNPKDFEDTLGFEKPDTSDEVILYCKAGARSAAASEYLKSLGYCRVRNYPGSYMEWASKNMN